MKDPVLSKWQAMLYSRSFPITNVCQIIHQNSNKYNRFMQEYVMQDPECSHTLNEPIILQNYNILHDHCILQCNCHGIQNYYISWIIQIKNLSLHSIIKYDLGSIDKHGSKFIWIFHNDIKPLSKDKPLIQVVVLACFRALLTAAIDLWQFIILLFSLLQKQV